MLSEHKEIRMCKKCFNLYSSCHCNEGFINVDRGMLYIIQTLNIKGYRTIGCCEGHDKEELGDREFDGYLAFEKWYDFNIPIPKIFEVKYGTDRLKDCIFLRARESSKTEFLHTLREWAMKLNEVEK